MKYILFLYLCFCPHIACYNQMVIFFFFIKSNCTGFPIAICLFFFFLQVRQSCEMALILKSKLFHFNITLKWGATEGDLINPSFLSQVHRFPRKDKWPGHSIKKKKKSHPSLLFILTPLVLPLWAFPPTAGSSSWGRTPTTRRAAWWARGRWALSP